MSKQRPSTTTPRKPARPNQPPRPGFQAAYWRRRLFKNSFTRDGQRTALKGWSVKIQHRGRRRTFSLTAANRAAAAREAWQIYESIVAPGREAIARRPTVTHFGATSASPGAVLESAVLKGASYWKPRLLHRKYLEFAQTNSTEEYSVRIEHAGTSHYFRLGTSHAGRAAIQAARIQRVVMGQGWEAANARFRRELTLAFRWTDNPVAWTYTTIHTPTPAVRTPPVVAVPNPTAQLNVAVVEADAGLRHTLASCIADQPEFCCIATFATLPEALRWLSRWQIRILLANHSLASTSEKGWVGELKTIAPSVTCLPYSVYEDSDQLFASVPGGAAGYFLKRLPSNRLLEPVAATVGGSHFSSHESAAGALQYFRRLLQPLPDSHGIQEISKLTHREQEVLSLLSKGYLDKSIADALKISIWTVHGHVKNIFQKLNVHTRIGAVVKFLQK